LNEELDRFALARALEAAGAGKLRSRLAAGESKLAITGLMGPARSLAEAVLAAELDRPVLLVVSDERRVTEAVSDLSAFLLSWGIDKAILTFPALAVDPYRGLSPHFDAVAARARALAALVTEQPVVVVAPATALLYRTTSPEVFSRGIFELAPGRSFEPGQLERQLLEAGYLHEDPVVAPGDFARRGGIVDLYPPGRGEPIRLEFIGDELEEIRTFDPETQRTTGAIQTTSVYPAREWSFTETHRRQLLEILLERDIENGLLAALERGGFPPGVIFALPHLADFRATIFDYLGQNRKGVVLVEEPADLEHRAGAEWERVLESYAEASAGGTAYPEPAEILLTPDDVLAGLSDCSLSLEEMDLLDGAEAQPADEDAVRRLHVSSQLLPVFRGRLQDFLTEVRCQRDAYRQVHIFVGNRGLAERMIEILQEADLSAGLAADGPLPPGSIALQLGDLSHGFVLPDLAHAVFAGRDVFAEPPRPEKRRARKLGRFLSDFRDLKTGDYVVHTDHGIGIFAGLKQVSIGSGSSEFVVLEYLGKDKLYLPVEKLDLLEKYSSAESAKPRLDKLGGTGWERVKQRVRKSMRDMARELLQLYAARKSIPGHAFNEDTHWQSEFEDSFEHQETPDQEQAIEEVKRDLEAPFPMDRLLCGDVGYGKTEVAMRAGFKAIMDNKQVAVLVPTTILAFQHFNTFSARFAPFPIRVEMLSRFKSPKQQKVIVKGLVDGAVDIVIGTHRLLSKDVAFKDLGLLVVDEEQRFGVTHKERLKQFRRKVDCLAMTATPIPRTLNMSLSGIRDLSVIETPPKDRMAIQTYLTRLDRKVLIEALRHELNRGGQVYFVHNRVGSIYSMASFLQRLVPEARIAVAHGQMKESELERTMLRFIRQEYDVLVSTTIIENGLDIPMVNTLIVNRADRFGLAQLYQLRGRVGRSNRRAYAYLLVPDERQLTPIARRRLAAIREFSDLGAGFRIAALDLELRGAGNLLGGEQHGHIEAVGFDLYCKLLEQTVHELSEEGQAELVRSSLNLKIDLRIPDGFIADTNQRMSVYKRVSSASDEEVVDRLGEEIRDRYGPLPEPVLLLLEFARLRLAAERLRIVAVEREGGWLAFRFDPSSPVEPDKLVDMAGQVPGAQLTPGGLLKLPVGDAAAPELLSMVREVLLDLAPYSMMADRAEP
jgi:transcription-repair coupling factor (superfamily II helicase)